MLILPSLLKALFPLLPRTSSSLRAFIRKTILSDIRTANLRTKNHKLNRAVQATLFAMVECGMDGDVVGDKGKLKSTAPNGEDAMWAVILAKELWRKQTWTDAKTVAIVALGCFHPVIKVQSASLHFFLGSDQDKEDSDDESDHVSLGSLSFSFLNRHRRWTSGHSITAVRSTRKRAALTKNSKSNSTPPKGYVSHLALFTHSRRPPETTEALGRFHTQLSRSPAPQRPAIVCRKALRQPDSVRQALVA